MTPPVKNPMKPLVLMIEDDPQIRRFLRATLAAEEYQKTAFFRFFDVPIP